MGHLEKDYPRRSWSTANRRNNGTANISCEYSQSSFNSAGTIGARFCCHFYGYFRFEVWVHPPLSSSPHWDQNGRILYINTTKQIPKNINILLTRNWLSIGDVKHMCTPFDILQIINSSCDIRTTTWPFSFQDRSSAVFSCMITACVILGTVFLTLWVDRMIVQLIRT